MTTIITMKSLFQTIEKEIMTMSIEEGVNLVADESN
jgi:hypothetical protein